MVTEIAVNTQRLYLKRSPVKSLLLVARAKWEHVFVVYSKKYKITQLTLTFFIFRSCSRAERQVKRRFMLMYWFIRLQKCGENVMSSFASSSQPTCVMSM